MCDQVLGSKQSQGWVWWDVPVYLGFMKLRQEDISVLFGEVQDSLDYTARHPPNKQTSKRTNKQTSSELEDSMKVKCLTWGRQEVVLEGHVWRSDILISRVARW